MAAGAGSLWVVNDFASTVSRVDVSTGTVEQTVQVDRDPTAIAYAAGSIWVACNGTRSVDRINAETETVVQHVPVGNGPSGIAVAPGAIWVTNRLDDTITEIDAVTGHRRRTLPAGANPSDAVFGFGALWIANESTSTVTRLDPGTGGLEDVAVGNGPEAVAVGEGSVWVANSLDGTVSRIDPGTEVVTATITVGAGAASVLVSDGSVWAAASYGGVVTRIDPATNRVVDAIKVGNGPQSLAAIDGRIWMSVRQTAVVHRGGTLRIDDFITPAGLDTGVEGSAESAAIASITADGLIGFKRVGGLDGGTLVPDLALSIPNPTDGGRTYVFHLRPGITYSNGVPVRASDLRRVLERQFRLSGGNPQFYSELLGAAKCTKAQCDLSRGVVADDRTGTVTLHLDRPDSEFLDKLALPFADLAPPGIPLSKPAALGLPGTGPYRIESYRHLQLVLVRNRHFRQWSAAAQPDGYPDKIVWSFTGSRDKQLTAVEHGQADLMTSPPAGRLTELATRFAAQVHVFPAATTFAIFLNTRVAPFDNLAARQAFNFALDRGQAIPGFGGADAAAVTCQILPPGMPSYRPYCPYTQHPTGTGVWSAPDLEKARELVKASGTEGQKVTFWTGSKPFQLVVGRLALATLEKLGYRPSLKVVDFPKYFGVAGDSRARAQAGFAAWGADYPAASNFLTLFTCGSFEPASPENESLSELCNPRIQHAVDSALAVQIADGPVSAGASWTAVDRLVTDIAAWAPVVNTRNEVVVSRRVGNLQANTQVGVLVDQMWVK